MQVLFLTNLFSGHQYPVSGHLYSASDLRGNTLRAVNTWRSDRIVKKMALRESFILAVHVPLGTFSGCHASSAYLLAFDLPRPYSSCRTRCLAARGEEESIPLCRHDSEKCT